jgi:hypothetical protein
VQAAPHATGEGRVDAVALASAVRRWGWRLDHPTQPGEPLSRAHAVLASRSA